MLLYLVLHLICATTGFLYPTYASYKTLSKRPADERDIERWLMYWSVLGIIVGAESIAGWTISWIPFYTPAKTLFLLYLSLPSIQGSSYIYTHHLHPFLLANEPEIDLKIGEVRSQFWEYLARFGRAALMWFAGIVGVSGGVAGAGASFAGLSGGVGAGAGAGLNGEQGELDSPPSEARARTSQSTPTAATMMSAPAQALLGLWRVYGPQIAAFMEPTPEQVTAATRQARQQAPAFTTTTPATTSRTPTTVQTAPQGPTGTSTAVDRHHDLQHNHAQILARRRALEAELAALPPVPMHDPYSSMTASIPAGTSTSTSVSAADSSSPSKPFSSLEFRPFPVRSPSDDTDKGNHDEAGRDGDDDGDEFADVDVVNDVDDRKENGGASAIAGRYWWWGGESSRRAAGYERVKTE